MGIDQWIEDRLKGKRVVATAGYYNGQEGTIVRVDIDGRLCVLWDSSPDFALPHATWALDLIDNEPLPLPG